MPVSTINHAESLASQGRLPAAEAEYRAVLKAQWGTDDAVRALTGLARIAVTMGQHDAAENMLRQAVVIAPDMRSALHKLGDFAQAFARADLQGQVARAQMVLAPDLIDNLLSLINQAATIPSRPGLTSPGSIWTNRIGACWPDRFDDAIIALSRGMFPGPHYLDVLAAIHDGGDVHRYIEIGTHAGQSLALAHNAQRAIGVDPEPVVDRPLSKSTQVFSTESDRFFSDNNMDHVLGGPADLGFVDGLHLSEQCLRDILNLAPYIRAGGLVAVHDCWPPHPAVATRDWTTFLWTGDVWRALAYLVDHRPELQIAVVATRPSGVGLIAGLNASHYADPTVIDSALFAPYTDLNRDLLSRITLLKPDPAALAHWFNSVGVSLNVAQGSQPDQIVTRSDADRIR